MTAPVSRILLLGLCLSWGCTKVGITDIQARFDLADAAWFADEETLFFFYELTAEQGLSDQSIVEVSYQTDTGDLEWTPIEALTWVHTHVAVDCGFKRRCGSLSLHVPIEPRSVGIRLRYHRDGPLSLDTLTVYNVIGPGPAHSNRSFLVYGVFTEDNRRIQWRGRHRFPTLRNERVTELGLRREFTIEAQRYGTAHPDLAGNPYGYATPCFDDFIESGIAKVSTQDRAVFNPSDLPLDASTQPLVCARVTVPEAKGPFITIALAQKNPEVEPAFPVLRTPVREATPIKFYLAPCDRVISEAHDEMQRQRLLFGDGPARCTDDWRSSTFVDALVVEFRNAIELTRAEGRDMVLVVGLHRDELGVAEKVEEALATVLPDERDRGTPRVVGGFVFDSEIRSIVDDRIRQLVLWCPAQVAEEEGPAPDPSQVACAIVPDNARLNLGPFSFSSLPILPSRGRYLDFIDRYSKGQAGEVRSLTFLAPEFTPTTDNTDLGGAVATFFNGELISAQPEDAFSFCATERFQSFVFRSQGTASEELKCPDNRPPRGEFCLPEDQDFLPIEFLPPWHDAVQETRYELGLVWDFPWLLRATYEVVLAANVGAFGLSVPFGFGSEQTDQLGTELWQSAEFRLDDILSQCQRFCDHPTFDSAGIYQVTDTFRQTYLTSCYRPKYPAVGDSSYPSDP